MINPDYRSRLHRKGPRAGYTSMVCRHCLKSCPIERIKHFVHRKGCRLYEPKKVQNKAAVNVQGNPASPSANRPLQVDGGGGSKTQGWKPAGSAEEATVGGE
jgi:hypothetical protein